VAGVDGGTEVVAERAVVGRVPGQVPPLLGLPRLELLDRGPRHERVGGVPDVQVLEEPGVELLVAGGAARAPVVPLGVEHEVVRDELTSTLEQVGEVDGSGRTGEHVVGVDLDHGEVAALGVEGVALGGERLLLGEQGGASGEPLVSGRDAGQAHAGSDYPRGADVIGGP
jgi:hypothetical protein